MSARIANVAVVVGVSLAGVTAMLVNLEVLRHADGAGAHAGPVPARLGWDDTPVASMGSATTTAVTVARPAATTAAPPTTLVTAPPTPVPSTGGVTRYRAGDAGTVLLSTDGGRLGVAGVEPADGWQVVVQDAVGAAGVRVVLRSDSAEVTFDAVLGPAGIDAVVSVAPVAAPETSVPEPPEGADDATAPPDEPDAAPPAGHDGHGSDHDGEDDEPRDD